MSSIIDIQQRIADMCLCIDFGGSIGAIQSAVLTGTECLFESGNLPAVWVRRGRLRRTNRPDNATKVLQREYQIVLYVAELCGNDIDDNPLRDRAASCIEAVHIFFDSRPTLELNDAGIVMDSSVDSDTGDRALTINGRHYAGVTFTLQVADYLMLSKQSYLNV